jgi:hypothetical protein
MKKRLFFSFDSFFGKKSLREFWCHPPLKTKHNHGKKKKKSFFSKRKIERMFWKLSVPSQIVAGPLRLKHD